MSYEPTPIERQERAFALLRDQARLSHQEGDGLRVNHLCEIAYQEAMRLVGRKQLLLNLHELQWMTIFKLYWLVDDHSLHNVDEVLKNIVARNESDNLAVDLIKCYHYLVSQPLSNEPQVFEKLNSLSVKCFGLEATSEMTEAVVHQVELIWFRSVGDEFWIRLIDKWIKDGASWLAAPLKATKERLVLQRRLTSPDKLHPILTHEALDDTKIANPLAELWLLHLLGSADVLHRRVQEATTKMHPGAYQWRIFADFWHINSMKSRQQGEDTQGVWLARRGKLTTDYPLLVFQDRRELQIGEQLRELHRRKSESSASTRWRVLQLSTLHELAALRYWDYGMWREATRAQSEILLDAAQWSNANTGLTMHGILLGLRAGVVQSPDKDPLIATAIRLLEFASSNLLGALAEGIFNVYPIHRHQAADLLEGVGDLLPSDKWASLAVWTTKYAQQSRESHGMGWRMNPLKCWNEIFPSLGENSTVWQVLQPEMVLFAENTFLWHGNDKETLILWLALAPQVLANSIADILRNMPNVNESDSYARATILCSAEDLRGTSFREWTEPMLRTAAAENERLLLAQHLEDNSAKELLARVRLRIASSIHSALTLAVPPANATTFQMGTLPNGLYLIETWSLEDMPILQELIDAVNSPNILEFWLYQVIQATQWLVSYGPREFAEMVQPHVKRWLSHPPEGRSNKHDLHAFSTVRIEDNLSEEVHRTLGWLVLQLHRKLGRGADAELSLWTKISVTGGNIRSLPLALKVCLILAVESSEEDYVSAIAMLHAIITTLKIRSHDKEGSVECVANALHYLAGDLSQESHELLDWSTDRGHQVLSILFDILEQWVPELYTSPTAEIRSGTARLLWNLRVWNQLSETLSATLEKLQSDARARVRFEAFGGWSTKGENNSRTLK